MEKSIQDFSLHTHTIGFDGRSTPTQMVARAQDLGMTSLGISNHFIVHPNITKSHFYPYAVAGGYKTIYSSSFDEAIAKFKPHYEELCKLQDTVDIKLYRGMEVDFFDYSEWRGGFDRAVKVLKPDYIICASHFIEYDGMLYNVHDMATVDEKIRDKMVQMYWDKLGRAARTGVFNWMAHLDLPKKTGCGRDERWVDTECKAMLKVARSKTPIEINTGLYRTCCDEPYPSSRILEMASDMHVPVLLSDDAHAAQQIGRNFDRAYELAKSCGITRFLNVIEAVRSR